LTVSASADRPETEKYGVFGLVFVVGYAATSSGIGWGEGRFAHSGRGDEPTYLDIGAKRETLET
jgi:hypothetical protein